MARIPKFTAPIAGALLVTPEWWKYLQGLSSSGDLSAIQEAIAELQSQVSNASGAKVVEGEGIRVTGSEVARVSLRELQNAGGGALLKVQRDDFGRLAGTSAANLADLADVADAAAAKDDGLFWTGTAWAPKSVEWGVRNLDGGRASTIYGGTTGIDGGGA